ncbi:MAG TPA: thermonuclease family protein [Chthoniobacterales bacterium]|nr:thermonuclease family protein [Chthoniobacterales bacterium]
MRKILGALGGLTIFSALIWLGLIQPVVAKGKEWVTLENCELVPNPGNDGDSFHIRSDGTEYFVRLYFVDAPEIKGIPGPERLVAQAEYFGISVPQVIEVGRQAKALVDAALSERFTVVTRMAQGLGRSRVVRFYGIVKTKNGDLAEQLVAHGLVRVHGVRAAPPDGPNSGEIARKLEQLENEAKEKKVGAWGMNANAADAAPQQH